MTTLWDDPNQDSSAFLKCVYVKQRSSRIVNIQIAISNIALLGAPKITPKTDGCFYG